MLSNNNNNDGGDDDDFHSREGERETDSMPSDAHSVAVGFHIVLLCGR